MAIYASSQTRGTERVDVVSLGTIGAPLPSVGTGQLFVSCAAQGQARPTSGQAHPMAVHSSTSVPSGQRT